MMTEKNRSAKTEPGSAAAQWSLIAAQLLTLMALAMGLQFLFNTTGGTLFLFASVAPLLVTISVVILLALLIHSFRKRHSLFDIETYEPGQIIFRQGDAGDCAYFIQSGEVEVVREGDGTETVLEKLSTGQYFGEMALLSNAPRNATVRVLAATRLAVLGKGNFLTMLSVLPSTREDTLKTVQERAMKRAAG